MLQNSAQGRLRVGLLDLDIFGPSVPKHMGLEFVDEPRLSEGAALRSRVPIETHQYP